MVTIPMRSAAIATHAASSKHSINALGSKVADFVRDRTKLEEIIHFKLIGGMVGSQASVAFAKAWLIQPALGHGATPVTIF